MRKLLLMVMAVLNVGGFSFSRESLPIQPSFVFTREVLPQSAASLPHVRFYSATWCKYCPQTKRQIDQARKAGLLPFDVDLIDVSNGGQPEWCDTIPTFAWDVNGQTYYVQDY